MKAMPRIGQWYRHLDKGESFVVTGVDEAASTVETQSFDGDLDEVELESWAALSIAPIEPPEDWTGPVDSVAPDDLGDSETGLRGYDWESALRTLPESESWQSSAEAHAEQLELEEARDADLSAADVTARDLSRANVWRTAFAAAAARSDVRRE